ncbi:MAG TPA: hypothetical protein VK052_16730, partial [Zeimonas sp.]|nr:hypothetical protein [Zeimonas sp.]
AIEELRDTTAAAKVALVGLRLGAALAARVAARRPEDVDALVLWDPVVGGDEYLGELVSGASYAMDCVPRPADAGGGYDVLGFPLTGTLMKEIAAIDLCELVPAMPARMLVLASQALPSHQRLEAALARRPAAEGALERIECEPAWLEKEDLGAGAIPVAILQRITGWFG